MARPSHDAPAERHKEQCEIVRTIGQRLRESRELCNMSQQVAAEHLGYANSSKLAKIENASDTNSVPLWLLVRAAKLYDVSIDYLFGLSDDFESDPMARDRSAMCRWLLNQKAEETAKELAAIHRLSERLKTVEEATNVLADVVNEFLDVILTVWTKHPAEFEELPGGSLIISALQRSDSAARTAKTRLRRFQQNTGLRPAA